MDRRAVLKIFGVGGALARLGPHAAWGQALPAGEGVELPGPIALEGHTGVVLVARFDGDGGRIATGSQDATLAIWESDTGRERPTFQHDCPVSAAAFSPDGRQIASGAPERNVEDRFGFHMRVVHKGGVIRIWDLAEARAVLTIGNLGISPIVMAYGDDGRTLISLAEDYVLTSRDASTGALRATMAEHRDAGQGHGSSPYSWVAFGPDARRVAAISKTIKRKNAAGYNQYAQFILTWDLDSGRTRAIEPTWGTVGSIAISPDGSRIVAGAHDGSLTFLDFATGEIVRKMKPEVPGKDGYHGPLSLAFRPDGKRLAAAWIGGGITIHDGLTGARLQAIGQPEGHQGEARAIHFGDRRLRVVSGGVNYSKKKNPSSSMSLPEPLFVWQAELEG